MRYMGSKRQLAKHIIPVIQSFIADDCVGYYEPFTGGGNVIDKITCKNRIGADIEPYVIACLSALRDGWDPPKVVDEALYKDIQKHKESYAPELVGYVGYQLSYGGKFFGGYRRDKEGKRDYCAEAYRFTQKQIPLLSGIEFICQDYRERDLSGMDGWVIYCDPPYRYSTKYSTGEFSYENFYDWCRLAAKRNIVIISEEWMPDDFEVIWSKSVNTCLDSGRKKGKERVERLFLLK